VLSRCYRRSCGEGRNMEKRNARSLSLSEDYLEVAFLLRAFLTSLLGGGGGLHA
jgi:hypothetical protein